MSTKTSSVRSTKPVSSTSSNRSSSSTVKSKGRYLRPVPYATTLALDQFFDGGTIEQHIARRATAAAAKPSPLSPHHHYHQQSSHRQSRQTSASTRDTRKTQQHATSTSSPSGRRKSEHQDQERTTRRPEFAPVLAVERDVGRGASLPVVDEKGQVWYDWEERQEWTPLITVEHERSGWVNFPGAIRSGSTSSSNSDDGEGSDGDDGLPSPITPAITLPLHRVLDAFTFQPPPAAGGGGGGPATAAVATVVVDPKDPLHGLQVPTGERPRGKARRVVRRADSLPALVQANKDAAAREFLDASFDTVQAMRAQQQLQQQQHATAAADASTAHNNNRNKLAFASMSMKGLKKMFSRKKSTSA